MHEAGIARQALEYALNTSAARDGRRITRLRLALGSDGHMAPESFSFHFEALSAGTVAEGAALEFEDASAGGRCLGCGAWRKAGRGVGPCPNCGSTEAEPLDAHEIYVLSVETADLS